MRPRPAIARRHEGQCEALAFAEREFGYRTVLLDGNEHLPVADKSFDVIFCSSVIEHITGPKDEAVALFKRDGRRFSELAFDYQKRFAEEIRRAGHAYFVQAPNRASWGVPRN